MTPGTGSSGSPHQADGPIPNAPSLASALQNLLGYHLLAWEPDRAVLGYTIRPEHLNRANRLHGGVLATLLDASCGFAGSYAPEPEPALLCVTLSLTVNYIGSITEGLLVTEARRTGGGRTIFFAAGDVRDEAGRLIASATGSFRYVHGDPTK